MTTPARGHEKKHLFNTGHIPVYATDRGGQVTYHGLGQLVVYILVDIQRRQWGVKQLVHALEQSVIDYLASQDICGQRRIGAPGVYVEGRKLSALGLRVRHGRTYHGLSLNVAMDLTPFYGINPCGYPGLEVTQLRDLGVKDTFSDISIAFIHHLVKSLHFIGVKVV